MGFYMTHKSFFILLGNPFLNLCSSLHIQATTDELSHIIGCFFFSLRVLYTWNHVILIITFSHLHSFTHSKKYFQIHVSLVSENCSVTSDSLQTHGLELARLPIHVILQARILEWIAVPFFRGSSKPRDRTQVSHITGGFFTIWATSEAQIHATVNSLLLLNVEWYSIVWVL